MITSVITTHAGHEPYLRECIESGKEHTDEVIVYDNGGKLEHLCSDVWYVPGEDIGYPGCVRGRNLGIDDAGSDHILFLDGDDWLMRRPPEDGDLCFSDMYRCNDWSALTWGWSCAALPTTVDGARQFVLEGRGDGHSRNPIPGKCIFRTAFLRDRGIRWTEGKRATFGEDVRIILDALEHDPSIVYVPETPYYVYRYHDAQTSRDESYRELFRQDLDEWLEQQPWS